MQTTRLLILAVALTLPISAAALTIDNFEEGDFNTIDTVDLPVLDEPTTSEQTGSTANIAGGVRFVRVAATGDLGALAIASLATAAETDDSLALTGVDSGAFTLIWDGIANGTGQTSTGALGIDLSSFDALALEVTAAATSSANITVWTSTGSGSTGAVPLTIGTNLFLLEDLGIASFTNVRSIRLILSGVTSTSISDFSAVTVPEPGTALLLAGGLTALAARRRKA